MCRIVNSLSHKVAGFSANCMDNKKSTIAAVVIVTALGFALAAAMGHTGILDKLGKNIGQTVGNSINEHAVLSAVSGVVIGIGVAVLFGRLTKEREKIPLKIQKDHSQIPDGFGKYCPPSNRIVYIGAIPLSDDSLP